MCPFLFVAPDLEYGQRNKMHLSPLNYDFSELPNDIFFLFQLKKLCYYIQKDFSDYRI